MVIDHVGQTAHAKHGSALSVSPALFQVGAHKMHYVDEGESVNGKPVLVFLHGNPTWSFYYRDLILKLRGRYRIIAPDHIGCGKSDHPEHAHFRADDRVQHIRSLLKHLSISKYALVMHDWGGPIGTGVATEEPEEGCCSGVLKYNVDRNRHFAWDYQNSCGSINWPNDHTIFSALFKTSGEFWRNKTATARQRWLFHAISNHNSSGYLGFCG